MLANWSAFEPTPWTALYVWQPAYLPYTGVMLGIAYAAWRLRRRPRSERWRYLRVLGAGYAAGGATLAGVFLALHLFPPATSASRRRRARTSL